MSTHGTTATLDTGGVKGFNIGAMESANYLAAKDSTLRYRWRTKDMTI